MSLLITRPRHDPPTHYLFFWSKKIIELAKKKGLKVIDISKNKVTKNIVESYLKKVSIGIAIFNGHGSDIAVGGHDDKEIIISKDNTKLLNGKQVYIRACNSGKILGKDIMSSGAKGFVGYTEPFIFPHKDSIRNPLGDEVAKPCLECSNQVAISLVKGHSAREAHEYSIKIYQKKINEMLTSGSKDTYTLPFLQWNMVSQVCYEK